MTDRLDVGQIMTRNPVCCVAGTPVSDVAQMMVDRDCGAIPIVGNAQTRRPIKGIVTDRDIVCRAVARRKDLARTPVEECMSLPVVTIRPDDSIEQAIEIMERYQVRRVPVVGPDGELKGLLSQAHIAGNLPEEKAGELLRLLSRRTAAASGVPGAGRGRR